MRQHFYFSWMKQNQARNWTIEIKQTALTDLFDFKARPTHFAVMGNPVKHSKSPQIHTLFAQQCGVRMDYDRIQVDTGGFEQAVSHFNAHGGAGLNITVPYKVEAWKLCQMTANTCSQRANTAEAVNTLKINPDGSVHGDNTDGMGWVNDLQNNIGFSLADKNILIIGAGGAVRGVLGPLLDQKPLAITVCNRTLSKAQALADQYGNSVTAEHLQHEPAKSYDLIINGTAASLDNSLPGIRPQCIAEHTTVYDMMYGDQPTIFMSWALSVGSAGAFDGLGMLVEQAALSFEIWHDVRPSSAAVIEAIRKIMMTV